MTGVDPDDDSIRRYVVRRYTYDPQRRERRHRVVAAFDSEAEFMGLIHELNGDLERHRADGQPIDWREQVSGVVLEPNHARRQRDRRLLLAAFTHGATISEEFLEQLDLPQGWERPKGWSAVHNAAVLRARSRGMDPTAGSSSPA